MDAASGEKLGHFKGALPVTTFDISPDGSRVAGVRLLKGEVNRKKLRETTAGKSGTPGCPPRG